jgi:glycosyltransferase involved in cell wall biosynthesis
MQKLRTTLIVTTYNNAFSLRKVLDSLTHQTLQPDEVIIADDGSEEPTKALIEEFINYSNLTLRHCWHEHVGFRRSEILNKSIAMARGEYIIFLDGDCVAAPNFISDHATQAESGYWVQGRRSFVAESCTATFTPSKAMLWRLALTGKLSGWMKSLRLPLAYVIRGQQQRGIIGCNMAIWREDLVAVNGYDESFVGWGREDSDIANRLYHLGRHRKLVYGRMHAYHLNHPITPRDNLQTNDSLLHRAIAEKRVRALKGLDQYLNKETA